MTTVDTHEPGTVEDTAVWKPGDRARLVFDAVLIAVGVGYLVLAVDLGPGSAERPGPGFFPVIAGTLCAGFLAADFVRVAVAVARHGRRAGTGRVPAQVWLILGAIAGYLVVVDFLGHALTAAVVVATLLKVLGNRRWWAIAVIALVAGFGSDLLFTYLLGLRLPLGLLEVGFSAWT